MSLFIKINEHFDFVVDNEDNLLIHKSGELLSEAVNVGKFTNKLLADMIDRLEQLEPYTQERMKAVATLYEQTQDEGA